MDSEFNTPTKGTGDLDDVLGQLGQLTVTTSNKVAVEDSEGKSPRDVAMAKLHALLSQAQATPIKSDALKRAKRKRAHQTKYSAHETNLHDGAQDGEEEEEEADMFEFLELPAELRLLVYRELLVTDGPILVHYLGPRKANKQLQKRTFPEIMRTCKLCFEEGAVVLYGDNVFDFEEIRRRPHFDKAFINSMGPHNPARIRLAIASYSALSEELSRKSEKQALHHMLTIPFLSSFLKPLNMDLSQLRFFAINIIPFSQDEVGLGLVDHPRDRNWNNFNSATIKYKNGGIGKIAEEICEREKGFRHVSSLEEIEKFTGLETHFLGQHWLVLNHSSEAATGPKGPEER